MNTERKGSADSGVLVSDVVHFLEEIVSLNSADSLKGVGLVVGDRSSTVTGILVCLSVTEEVLEEAIEKDCNLLVASYPICPCSLERITPESYRGRFVIKAIHNRVSIYILNGHLDHLGFGPSHRIADLIGLTELKPLIVHPPSAYKLPPPLPTHHALHKGRGLMGVLPVGLPTKYFLKYVKTKLNLLHLQHTRELDEPIKKVAIYAGSDHWLFQKALDEKIDAFIATGFRYQDFLEANGRMLLLDIGHHATQFGLKKLIVALLSKEFNNIVVLRCKTATNPVYYTSN